MQAVWLTRFGAPDVLVARDTPDPIAADGEVIVDVAAVSITFIETLIRAGRMPFPGGAQEPPYIPGNGVGGTVSSVGAGADPSWIGRRVVTGTGGSGGYAERVAVPASGLIPVPDGLDLADATALLADGRTALGLFSFAAPEPGEWVLVEAAAGGVGTLLVQLVRDAGANVVAAASGRHKLAVAEELGAALTVDYGQPGWEAAVPAVDVTFDGVGGAIGAAALARTRPGGRFVQFGLASGQPTDTSQASDVTVIGFDELRGLASRSAELAAAALDRAAAGTLRPVIGQTFALAHAADAHSAIESRGTIGKTLLLTGRH